MSYLEQFMDRIVIVPNDVNRYLRLIRFLDKKVQNLQLQLNKDQKQFYTKMKDIKEKKIDVSSNQLKIQFEQISKKQQIIYGYAKEKTQIASQLYHLISEYHEGLQKQIKGKMKQKSQEQSKKKKLKENNKIKQRDQQYLYDPKQDKFCLCRQPSFGQMVGCENNYCQPQWFHLSCLEQKALPQKWYCSDCHKLKQKTRNPFSKSYL